MSTESESFLDPRDETIRHQAVRRQELEAEVKRRLALLEGKATAKSAKKHAFKENESLDRNKNSKKKPKTKKSTGRKPTQNKRSQATRTIDVYAEGVDREQCVRHRSQLAWRIFDGKAVYVCYDIYDLPCQRSYATLAKE